MNEIQKIENKLSLSEIRDLAEDLIDLPGVQVKSKAEFMHAVMLAQEFGITAMAGLSLYDELKNPMRMKAAFKGMAMGFDFQTAQEKVYCFTNGEGKVLTSIATELMISLAIKAGISYEIIENCKSIYGYINIADNTTYLPEEVKENPEIFNIVNFQQFKDAYNKRKSEIEEKYKDKKLNEDAIKQIANEAKKYALNTIGNPDKLNVTLHSKPIDERTRIRYSRVVNGKTISQEFDYYYSQAVNAGLIKFDNPNFKNSAWSKDKKQMMIYRNFSSSLRVFAPDATNNIYSHSEALEIIQNDNIKVDNLPDENIEDAQIVTE